MAEQTTVAMVVLNSFPGDARAGREVRTLIKNGYQVTVFCLDEPGLIEREIVDGASVRRIRLRTRNLPRRRSLQAIKYLEFVFKALRGITSMRPAIVHTHDLVALPIGYLAKRRCGAKLVHDSHELESDSSGLQTESTLYRQTSRLIEHRLLPHADAVITVSDGIADEMASQDGIERPVVLRNLPESNVRAASPVDLRKLLGFSPDSRIVLYQGHISQQRGVSAMVDALPYLDEWIVFVIVGRRNLEVEENLVVKANVLGVGHRLKFVDRVPYRELLGYTASADVGIVPTLNSNKSYLLSLPNKLFEYIMAGIPVAVSDFPEQRRVVEQYDVGALFDPAHPKDVARAVDSILRPSARYDRLRRNAAKARQVLNWDNEQNVLLDLYDSLVSSRIPDQPPRATQVDQG